MAQSGDMCQKHLKISLHFNPPVVLDAVLAPACQKAGDLCPLVAYVAVHLGKDKFFSCGPRALVDVRPEVILEDVRQDQGFKS